MDVLKFIEEFKVARTTTISSLFYPSLRVAQKRLRALVAEKELKRIRDNVSSEYLYFKIKPKQLKHSLLLTDFYREFAKQVDIVGFRSEVSIEHLRADGLVGYKYNGRSYAAFVEVQISNTPLDINKYEVLYRSGAYNKYFDSFPLIIAITNKVLPNNQLKIIQVREEELSNHQFRLCSSPGCKL